MGMIAIGAVFVMISGHVLRAVRQATLFPENTRPGNFHLLVGLSLGHVINALVPFRVGEIVRALYVSRRADQGFGMIAATVMVERVSDLAIVGLLLAILGGIVGEPILFGPAATMALLAIGAFLVSTSLQKSHRIRNMVWAATSIFNDRIRTTLVDTIWTTAQLLTSTALVRPRFLLLTLFMWSAYLASYALLGKALGLDLFSVTASLLSAPLNALLMASSLSGALVLVTSLAALAILGAALITDGAGIRAVIRKALHRGLLKAEYPLLALSGASFARNEDYSAVLDAHFTNRQSVMASFGLHGVEGAVVRHMLPGGSDAVTAVVAIGDRLAIRKYAVGQAGDKLADQVRWLRQHDIALPLARVDAACQSAHRFHYDMPYNASARDLYEMAHVMPITDSGTLLHDVVERVAQWHDDNRRPDCSQEAVKAYVDRKIVANAKVMLEFARRRLPERYLINGGRYEWAEWNCMLDHDWVMRQMPTRRTSSVHGDLTIENIVVCPDEAPGWYLIDPNPENLFDSPLIDWAKLMQSLNLGYESLNRGPMARTSADGIDLMLNRSRAYAELHALVSAQLNDRLGAGMMREISFHEIVNYLRLIPYKIRQNPAKAMTFLAAASMLLRSYRDACDA